MRHYRSLYIILAEAKFGRIDNAARDSLHRERTSSRPSVSVGWVSCKRYLANFRLLSYWDDLLKRIQSGEIDPLKMVTHRVRVEVSFLPQLESRLATA